MFKISFVIILSILILKFVGSDLISTSEITLSLGDYEIIAKQNFVAFIIIITILLLILITYILFSLTFLAKHKRVISSNKKIVSSLDDMTKCITAINLGDFNESQKKIKQISKNISNHPLVNLLNLQSYALVNNKKAMVTNLEKLLNNKKTKTFALQGLAVVAQKNHNLTKAKHYLEEAYIDSPYAKNTIVTLLETYKQLEQWKSLEKLIKENSSKKILNKHTYSAELAIANLMIYKESSDLSNLTAAKKLLPDNQEIQIEYAKHLFNHKKKSTLTRYIKNIWKNNTHPELVELFFKNISNDNTNHNLSQLNKLIEINSLGEAAIVKYVEISMDQNIKLAESKRLLNKILEHSTSYLIYDIAMKFYSINSENESDNQIFENLLKQENNYNSKAQYRCLACNSEQQDWKALCKSCNSFNQLIYCNSDNK